MAPAVSHLHKLLVRNTKLLKAAWKSVQQNVAHRLAVLEPIPLRIRVTSQQPLHHIAALKQRSSQYRNSSRFLHTSAKANRSAWQTSPTRSAISGLTKNAPFASTLRPNLTGGALPRTSGGYSLGSGRIGGVRHFSHTPAAPAQVVQNVSQAIRAFLLSGHKAQFAGVNPVTGEKQYKAVSVLQDSTSRKMARLPMATPGSYVDFRVNPTITALTPLSAIAGYAGFSASETETETVHMNTNGLLDVLATDFSRALRDLAAILMDLKALSRLGDLPITYRTGQESTLRVHFPGCDADTVENLCRELNVKRGIVFQDENFDAFVGTEIALLFPFAPSVGSERSISEAPPVEYHFRYQPHDMWDDDPLFSSPDESEARSTQSESGYELFDRDDANELSPVLGSDSGRGLSLTSDVRGTESSPLEYQDFEGIYRFIELCDDARR